MTGAGGMGNIRNQYLMTPQCNLPEGFAAGAALKVDSTVERDSLNPAELNKVLGDDGYRPGSHGQGGAVRTGGGTVRLATHWQNRWKRPLLNGCLAAGHALPALADF